MRPPPIVVDCTAGTGAICISDFYTTLAGPLLAVLLVPVVVRRLRALRSETRLTGGQAAPLLASTDDSAPQLALHAARGCRFLLRRLLYACCALALFALNATAALSAAGGGALAELREPGTPSGPTWRTVLAVSHGVDAVAWGVVLLVGLYEARLRRHSSRGLRFWLVGAMLLSAVHLLSDALRAREGGLTPERGLRLAASSLALVVGLVALLEPDTPVASLSLDSTPYPSASSPFPAPKPSAEARASFLSRLAFSWCDETLVLGAKRPLEHADLSSVQEDDSTDANAALLSAAWAREESIGRRSFIRAWHRAFGVYFWTNGLLELVRLTVQFALPLLNQVNK